MAQKSTGGYKRGEETGLCVLFSCQTSARCYDYMYEGRNFNTCTSTVLSSTSWERGDARSVEAALLGGRAAKRI